jgi:hypothetical protein
MRKLIASFSAVFLLCILSVGVSAQEKDLKEKFTFDEDVLVNTTLVKKGTYLIKYNPETSEVKFMDGDNVVAKAKATVKLNEKEFDSDGLITTETSSGKKLTGLRLGGQREEITILDNVAERN